MDPYRAIHVAAMSVVAPLVAMLIASFGAPPMPGLSSGLNAMTSLLLPFGTTAHVVLAMSHLVVVLTLAVLVVHVINTLNGTVARFDIAHIHWSQHVVGAHPHRC